MNKFTKIAVSFLLIVSVVFSPLSFFSFNASSNAAVAFGEFFVKFIVRQFIWDSANYTINKVITDPEESADVINKTLFSNWEQFVTNCDYIQVSYNYNDHDNTFVPKSCTVDESKLGLTEEDKEKYKIICNTINNYLADGGNPDLVFYNVGGAYGFDQSGYNDLKARLIEENIKEVSLSAARQGLPDLSEALDGGIITPGSSFFVGPMPTMDFPLITEKSQLLKDGFVYKPPATRTYNGGSNSDSEMYWSSEAQCLAAGFYKAVQFGDNGWRGFFDTEIDCYAFGNYIIYKDKVFYNNTVSYNGNVIASGFSGGGGGYYPCTQNAYAWVCADGTTLANTDFTTGSSYQWGWYYNSTGEVKSATPVVETTITEDNFTTTTGGSSIELPRTDDEEIIGNAMGLGLVSPDATIEIGSDGTITSVDGITISKLQELCDLMADGNLAFEDIQQYLQVMTQLIQTGNFTEAEQITLLENINANVKSIEDVNTSIKQLVDVFDVSNAVVPKPQFVHDNLIGGGFSEAEALVQDALPIVNQAKDLLGNIFNWDDNIQEPPNFSFYWDSNKDGETEKYTLLDLSFMEQKLTNDNLDDKGRFVNSMTIREFVQSLIVLITYAAFAIKILRKLPGLIGGSEAMSDDVRTIS